MWLFDLFQKKGTETHDEYMKYLIVGLGNIGDEYVGTRHNVGFRAVDAFAQKQGAEWADKRYGAIARTRVKNTELILLKPSTYMNLSGQAVRYWAQQEKIPVEHLLVIVDDLSLPVGKIRMRGSGSDGGHNGLKNIAFSRSPMATAISTKITTKIPIAMIPANGMCGMLSHPAPAAAPDVSAELPADENL